MAISNKYAYFENIAFGYDNSNRAPVYRLNGPEHFYTINVSELLKIVNNGWKYEKIEFYAYKTATANTKPVYRLNGPEHFYTTSEAEKTAALKSKKWFDEGVAWYID
jgi:alpha/beta superfamily hydrolase